MNNWHKYFLSLVSIPFIADEAKDPNPVAWNQYHNAVSIINNKYHSNA